MKVLLINPAFYDEWEFKNRYHDFLDWVKGGNLYVAPFEPPLGLAYLSAFLKARGHQVELLDMQGLLMDSAELAKTIANQSYGLIGITAMTTTFPVAVKVAQIVRQVALTAKIAVGGVHPTLDPEGALAHDCFDFVLRGEGEVALHALVEALEQGGSLDTIPGLCYRNGEEWVIRDKTIIEDQSLIPMPDYDAFPVERYIKHNEYLRGIRGISMLISRGCPFPCSFCAVHQTMGRKWRVKPAARVVDEVLLARDRYQLEGIWFKDSIFNLNPAWTREFADGMIERRAGISWQANTRIDLIDEAELQLMKRAGLTQLDLGIETGSKRSLERLQKKITLEQIREKVKLAQKYVKVFGFFMIGIPGETETDVQETFALAKELELDRSTWSIYSPLPGSTLYDDLIAAGNIKPYDLNFEAIHFTKAYEGICQIAPQRLSELYHEINNYFYTRQSVQPAV